eukprot:gene8065-9921_t
MTDEDTTTTSIGNKRLLSPLKSASLEDDEYDTTVDNTNNNEDNDDDDMVIQQTTKRFKRDDINQVIQDSRNLIDTLDSAAILSSRTKKIFDEYDENDYDDDDVFQPKRMSITLLSGERKFVNIVPFEKVSKNDNNNPSSMTTTKYNLLSRSIGELKNEYEDMISRPTPITSVNITNNSSRNTGNNKLWVDKYAPTTFNDLLSDDKMNKDVLLWIKQWDAVVFNKPVPNIKKTGFNQTGNKPSTGGNPNNNNNNNNLHFYKKSMLDQQLQQQQEDNTPFYKIILLTGAPGLGKTTLAHILAKQAGYNPVEINASDDRSGSVFENKLLSAIEMKPAFNDQKPNCLIIDEIDGISGKDNGPIELIMKLIEGASGKQKKTFTRILRPIICICNDQYVMSLRKLRQKALVFNFTAPKKSRLLARLKEICLNEDLPASDATLSALIDMTGSDIRSCINTLQFFKAKSLSLNSTETLKNKGNILGLKDMEKGLFEIWKSIFQPESKTFTSTAPSNKSSLNNNIYSKASLASSFSSSVSSIRQKQSDSQREEKFESLKQMIQSSSQLDRLVEGVYENFLSNMNDDYNLSRTMDCIEWMNFSDLMKDDDRYRSLCPLAIHYRCSNQNPVINYPHSDYEHFLKKRQTQTICETFLNDSSPAVRSSTAKTCLTIDFLPNLIDVISIPIKAINPQLLSNREKINLNSVASIMKYYQLEYQLEKSQTETTLQYKLEPPIDSLLVYAFDKNPIKHIKLNNTQKQIITSAIVQYNLDKEKEKEKEREKTNNLNGNPYAKNQNNNNNHFKKPNNPSINALKNPPQTPTQPLPVLKDFFGKIIQTSPDQQQSKKPVSPTKGPNIKYRYQEGFTNAVKKIVYVKDFL